MAKVIILTGASRGLGAATARQLAHYGASVVLTARSGDDLAAIAAELNRSGGATATVVGDITEPATCQTVVETALSQFGQIDGLINNAGVLEPVAPLRSADLDQLRTNVNVNLLAPMLLTRLALPYLRTQRGRIVNVSSGAAVSPIAGWAAYCSVKAGINMLTRVIAEEESDVIAVALRPGVVDTEMQAVIRRQGGAGMEADSHRRFVELHNDGALLDPDLPAAAIAKLAVAATPDLSGKFIQWDDERISALLA